MWRLKSSGVRHVACPNCTSVLRRLWGLKYGKPAASNASRKTLRIGSALPQWPRLTPTASLLLFGGQAKDLPYPGSTTVSTVNGGVEGIVRTLVHEIRPHRVNCLHPGIVGDSPYWENKQAALEATAKRTPTGRLTSMEDIVGAAVFLLENEGMNGVNLKVDGGLHCM